MEKLHPDNFDRVEKALVDQLGILPDIALERLKQVGVEVSVSADVASSPTLQAALLTVVNLSHRIFKRAATVIDAYGAIDAPPLIPSHHRSLRAAVEAFGGKLSPEGAAGRRIVLGRGDGPGLRLSFDGWSARVGPAEWSPPLAQREYCVLAGIAGAGIALSEIFLGSLGFDIEAGKREIGISLWTPDATVSLATAPGPLVQYLPGEAWLLGLGHLGQGMVWALSMLPYETPSKMELLLQDFDRVKNVNRATQALTNANDEGHRKTRVCSDFLRGLGFSPGVVDRPFDAGSPRLADEPALALCGFDGSGPRHILDVVGFERVVVCGVGGTVDNFDDIQIHTIPLQDRTAKELWPPTANNSRQHELAKKNAFYREYHENHRCGELELAGVSVAVPFVGAVTGAMAWAEVLRELHGGRRAAFTGIPLRCVEEKRVRYSPPDSPRIRYARPHLLARRQAH